MHELWPQVDSLSDFCEELSDTLQPFCPMFDRLLVQGCWWRGWCGPFGVPPHMSLSCGSGRIFLSVVRSRLLVASAARWALPARCARSRSLSLASSSSCLVLSRLCLGSVVGRAGAWHPPALSWVPRPGCRAHLGSLGLGCFSSPLCRFTCRYVGPELRHPSLSERTPDRWTVLLQLVFSLQVHIKVRGHRHQAALCL